MKYSALIMSFSAMLLAGPLSALADRIPSLARTTVLTVPVRPDALIVPVVISGRQYHFLLDTGISTLVIDNALASELTQRLPDDQVTPLERAILAAGIQTSGGPLPYDALLLWQPMAMAIGDRGLSASGPWPGMDLSALTQMTGVKIDGILGRDIFRQFAWQVDNQKGLLSVWQQAPGTLDYPVCVPYHDAYDSGPELLLDYHHRPVTMTVDTGVYYSYIGDELIKVSRERPESAVLTDINQPVPGLTGEVVSDGYSLSGLRFNQMPLGKLLARENKQGAYGLGMNFLARFDSYLFMPKKMLFCYRQQRFTRDEPAPQRILAVRYYAHRVEFFLIPLPHWPALVCKTGMYCWRLTA